MEVYLQAYYWFKQDNWLQWLAMAKLAYNNSQKVSTIMSFFKALLGYHT